MDEYDYFLDDVNDEDESTESDSGISTGSSTISSTSSFNEPTDDIINDIMKEINLENPLFIREMIIFSINGALASDIRLCTSAIVFLWKLFKLISNHNRLITEKILVNCPELLSSIKLLIFDDNKSKDLHFYISGIIYYVSKTKIGCQQILDNSIDALLFMMESDIITVVYYSFTCLHNILLLIPKSREIITKNYNLLSLINHICSTNINLESRLQLITIDILSRLATDNEINKRILFTENILQNCVRTLLNCTTNKVLMVHSQMIRVLSTNIDCKHYLLINDDFLRFLIDKCQQINDTHINRIYWSIILNISDKMLLLIDAHQMKMPKLINRMVRSIRNYHKIPISIEMVGVILCCLSNFSCHQEWVKDIIWKRGLHYSIMELLKTENQTVTIPISINTIEACYRCLNHIMSRLLSSSNDFLLKHYKQIITIMDRLKFRNEDEDIHDKLFYLSLNETVKSKLSNKGEFDNIITPIRTWAILITHIVSIESTKNGKRKPCQKEYQKMIKMIIFEVTSVTNYLTNSFLKKPHLRSREEEETISDLMNNLNILLNIKNTI